MRTTVGSLPPAVYWRRRAVVLGAVLLAVVIFFVSCSGGDDNGNKRGLGGASQFPTPAPAKSTPDDAPSFSDARPGGGPTLPNPDDLESRQPTLGPGTGTGDGTNANVDAPADGSCGDAEVAVAPVPASTTLKRGTPVEIRFVIRNIATRTCQRDIGAGAQEIYLEQGAQKFWSSDTCSTDRSADLEKLAPSIEHEYRVTWNGRQATKCAAGQAAGPAPNPGQYELRARLGSKISDPVTVTIVA